MSALEDIRARWEAATPGPWEAITTGRAGGDHWYVCADDESIASITASDGENEDQREPLAVAIAHAPTDVARLLAAVEGVLEVHRRTLTVQKRAYCRECSDDRDIWATYPCATIKAITTALEATP